ncbi:MAG: hypothetical protein HRU31_11120 [Rhodobacteraceae bacterium]|nr:hypothetical protein [Paracoccaceae bacterium]
MENIEQGGLAEAIVRMLVLLGNSRGDIRADRLQRSSDMLAKNAPFDDLSESARAEMIRQQTLVVGFEPDQAIASLPKLLRSKADREKAVKAAQYVAGALVEMAPETRQTLDAIRDALALPVANSDVTDNPLADKLAPTTGQSAAE